MNNKIKHVFNALACTVGPTMLMAGTAWNMDTNWANLGPISTASMLGGAGLFALGYSRKLGPDLSVDKTQSLTQKFCNASMGVVGGAMMGAATFAAGMSYLLSNTHLGSMSGNLIASLAVMGVLGAGIFSAGYQRAFSSPPTSGNTPTNKPEV